MQWLSGLLSGLGSLLGKYGSRKFLLATVGNLLLGLFAKSILSKAGQLGTTLVWAGIVACIAIAIGLWTYIIVEGRRDLEATRLQDPYYRGARIIKLFREARKEGLDADAAFRLIEYSLYGRGGFGCNRKCVSIPDR